MEERDTGGPAFPTDNAAQTGNTTWHYEGMTLRDYFAAMALAGSLGGTPGSHLMPDRLAVDCYRHADAMLKARSA